MFASVGCLYRNALMHTGCILCYVLPLMYIRLDTVRFLNMIVFFCLNSPVQYLAVEMRWASKSGSNA